jgi:dynactin complex subunit
MSEISKKELKKKLEKMEEELKLLNESASRGDSSKGTEKNKPLIPEKPIKESALKGDSSKGTESESESEEQPKVIEKQKRQRSDKQMEQFKKATLIKQQKAEERKRKLAFDPLRFVSS